MSSRSDGISLKPLRNNGEGSSAQIKPGVNPTVPGPKSGKLLSGANDRFNLITSSIIQCIYL